MAVGCRATASADDFLSPGGGEEDYRHLSAPHRVPQRTLLALSGIWALSREMGLLGSNSNTASDIFFVLNYCFLMIIRWCASCDGDGCLTPWLSCGSNTLGGFQVIFHHDPKTVVQWFDRNKMFVCTSLLKYWLRNICRVTRNKFIQPLKHETKDSPNSLEWRSVCMRKCSKSR